jgi:hypothetical protein
MDVRRVESRFLRATCRILLSVEILYGGTSCASEDSCLLRFHVGALPGGEEGGVPRGVAESSWRNELAIAQK